MKGNKKPHIETKPQFLNHLVIESCFSYYLLYAISLDIHTNQIT